jgi:hypothetical protein
MAIVDTTEKSYTLNNDELRELILDVLFEDYPDWHIVEYKKGSSFDFLLIKTFTKIVTQYINPGAPNPLHKDKEEKLQIVIAVTIDADHTRISDHKDDSISKWTYKHIFVDSIKGLDRALRDLEKENG